MPIIIIAFLLSVRNSSAKTCRCTRITWNTRITWSTRNTRITRSTRNTRSARITRTTSGAIRNAWSTLGIGSMKVRFNGGQV